MRRCALVALAWLLFACQQTLPSSTPLGSGPLAGEPRAISAGPTGKLASIAEQSDDEGDDDSSETSPDADAGAPEADAAAATEAGKEADGGESDAGTDATPASRMPASLAGRYEGSDVTIWHVQDVGDRREEDPNAKTDVADTKDGIDITLVSSASLDPICTLHASLNGLHAVVAPDQTCFSDRLSVVHGSADFKDDHMRLQLRLEGQVESENGAIDVSTDYRFQGDR